MNKQREKLIEMMYKEFSELNKDGDWNFTEMLGGVADYLLANGVTISTNKSTQIDLSDDFFGCVLNCAIRYCLGRESYMPSLVIDFITPLLSELSDKTLWCFERDIKEAENWSGYGNEAIDKPKWMRFLADVRTEQKRREDTE